MDEVQLNTLYIVTEGAFLRRDGQTVVVEVEGTNVARVPLHMVDSIACFGRVMVSPQLMESCAESQIAMNFLSANGRLLARVEAPGAGGMLLRRHHYHRADDPGFCLALAKSVVAGKIQNARYSLLRSARDLEESPATAQLRRAADQLGESIDALATASTLDVTRGIEGDAARLYFENFAAMTPTAPEPLRYIRRSRRPPLDPVNSLLSLFYSILTNDCVAALGAAGLDPGLGFLHEARPGRPSLALDLVEEFRAYLVDRFVITLINRKQVNPDDFQTRPGGAVELKDAAR